MKLSLSVIFSIFLFSGLFLLPPLTYATDPPDPSRILQDIEALSHPKFAGRQTGTEGGHGSAKFVADRFRQLGLTPTGTQQNSWEQTSPVTITHIQPPTTLEFSSRTATGSFSSVVPQLGLQFLPVLDSPSINVIAPIVFVGYGISDPARGWDEYEELDVRNRVVMFLRGKPPYYPLHIQHTEKERIARDKGAVGFITLTGPVLSRYAARRGMGHQPLAFYTNAEDERPLSGVWISGKIGSELFQAQGLSLTRQ